MAYVTCFQACEKVEFSQTEDSPNSENGNRLLREEKQGDSQSDAKETIIEMTTDDKETDDLHSVGSGLFWSSLFTLLMHLTIVLTTVSVKVNFDRLFGFIITCAFLILANVSKVRQSEDDDEEQLKQLSETKKINVKTHLLYISFVILVVYMVLNHLLLYITFRMKTDVLALETELTQLKELFETFKDGHVLLQMSDDIQVKFVNKSALGMLLIRENSSQQEILNHRVLKRHEADFDMFAPNGNRLEPSQQNLTAGLPDMFTLKELLKCMGQASGSITLEVFLPQVDS